MNARTKYALSWLSLGGMMGVAWLLMKYTVPTGEEMLKVRAAGLRIFQGVCVGAGHWYYTYGQ